MQSPSYHAAQAASLPAAQSLTEKEACGSTALHLANVHLCFLLESIAFFTSPGLFTQTSCSLTTRIAFFAILLTAQMSAVSLGVWWEPSPDPTQPSQQLLRKEIEAMLGSGVRGAGGLAGVWGEGGQGAWLGPAGKSSPRSPAPERGQLWASWEKPGTFQKTRRERFFKSGGGARHERVDKTPGKGTDLAGGRPGLQPRDPQGLPLWTQQSPQFGCLWTSSNKKRMRKIKNNYPSSWFGPKRLSSTWFAKALLSRVERSSRKKDEVFNVCVHLFQMIALRMLSFLFITSFNQVLLRPH